MSNVSSVPAVVSSFYLSAQGSTLGSTGQSASNPTPAGSTVAPKDQGKALDSQSSTAANSDVSATDKYISTSESSATTDGLDTSSSNSHPSRTRTDISTSSSTTGTGSSNGDIVTSADYKMLIKDLQAGNFAAAEKEYEKLQIDLGAINSNGSQADPESSSSLNVTV